MTSADPTLGNIICVLGILLVIVAAGWPIVGPLLKKRQASRTGEQDPGPPEAAGEFTRPVLSKDQESRVQASAIALAAYPFPRRVKAYHDLIAENVILLDEVNSHRRLRGIPELPVHPIKQ